jgi:FtsH-binding integral membrane protein
MSHSPQTKTTASPAADDHPVDFNKYIRTCVLVFLAVLAATSLMVWISFLPHASWPQKVGMILVVAACNAFVVAGFLMHLISEKKMIYTVLAFTVVFVLGLFWLTWYAMNDFPTGTTMH